MRNVRSSIVANHLYALYDPDIYPPCWIYCLSRARARTFITETYRTRLPQVPSLTIYGQTHTNISIRRAIFLLYIGDLPTDMLVLMRCDQHLCLNPDHMMLGTQRELQIIRAEIRKGHDLVDIDTIMNYPHK